MKVLDARNEHFSKREKKKSSIAAFYRLVSFGAFCQVQGAHSKALMSSIKSGKMFLFVHKALTRITCC